MPINALDITQKTLFGDDERTATQSSIVESVLRVMPYGLDRTHYLRITEFICALKYPAFLRFIKTAAQHYDKVPDTTLATLLDAEWGDLPHPETIAREIRRFLKERPQYDRGGDEKTLYSESSRVQ